MKTKSIVVFPKLLCLTAWLATCNLSVTAQAQGTAFTYQGRLNNNSAPANGSYDLAFTLFTTNVTGNAIAGPVTNSAVAVTNGLFTTLVDFGNAFTGTSNWLEIAVSTNAANNFTTLAPRQQLTPTPYALFASTANRLANGLTIQNNSDGAPNVIGGSSVNYVSSGVEGATIAGGGAANYFSYPIYVKFTNSVTGNFGTVGGGEQNTASGELATVGGGAQNTASGQDATVSGGAQNTASGNLATVSGGSGNSASGFAATVSGGAQNTASDQFATVSGGSFNTASGRFSFAAGRYAQAVNPGTFVWADSQNASFSSTANDQFLIRAQGGVGIGITTPAAALDVVGDIHASGTFTGDGSGLTGLNLNGGNAALATNVVSGINITNAIFTGNVGIGTANPDRPLTITGVGYPAEWISLQDTNGVTRWHINNNYNGLNFSQTGVADFRLFLGTNGNVGIGTVAPAYQLDVGGDIHASGTFTGDGSGLTGLNFNGGNSALATNVVAGINITNALFTGNVGIGTLVPLAPLHVFSADIVNAFIDGSSGFGTWLSLRNTGGGTNWQIIATGSGNGEGPGKLAFNTGPEPGSVSTKVMILDPTGKVGIGTANPDRPLTITGVGDPAEWISLQDANGVTRWHINNNYNGLNFSQTGVADYRLFLSTNGYVGIGTGNPNYTLDVAGDIHASGSVYAGSVQLTSDRNAKENFTAINAQEVLAKVAALPVSQWNYKTDAKDVQHLGPMAQDFKAAFNLDGADDKHISVVDESGVALAAIQGLNEKLDEKDKEIQELKASVEELKASMEQLQSASVK